MAKSQGIKQRQMARLRQLLLVASAVVVAAVLGFGIWYSQGSGEQGENQAVRTLDQSADSGDLISVMEFFSYACPHCRDFEPLLDQWKKGLADDVKFTRVALGGNRLWLPLAKAYYAIKLLGLEETSHENIFKALHDQNKKLLTTKAVASFIAKNSSVTMKDFLATAEGEEVAELIKQSDRFAKEFKIAAVPTMVVAGKFVVSTRGIGFREVLAKVNDLIEAERSARQEKG